MARLAQAIAKAPDARPGPQCGVHLLLDTLAKGDAADLRAALANRSITASRIREGLRTIGHDRPPSFEQTLNKHRRGVCGCPR